MKCIIMIRGGKILYFYGKIKTSNVTFIEQVNE